MSVRHAAITAKEVAVILALLTLADHPMLDGLGLTDDDVILLRRKLIDSWDAGTATFAGRS